MYLAETDFTWEPDQGLEGGAWVAWNAVSPESETYAVVQPTREGGVTYVDEMAAPNDYASVAAWWFDGAKDAFLDPATALPINTYEDFEMSEAPTFETFERAVSAFEEPPAR